MRDAEEIQEELAALKPQLRERYPIDGFGVFGSYARGKQRPDSDFDVIVTFEEPVTLFDLVRLEEELTRRLDVTVDLVTGDSLKPRVATRVAKDVVYV
jgi:predicted nucleotidyltransferase